MEKSGEWDEEDEDDMDEEDAERDRYVIVLMLGGAAPRVLPRGAREVFHALRLQFCVTDHEEYVPHARLSVEEKEAVLKKYASGEQHFPIMLFGDPVARYFAWGCGDMIQVVLPEGDRDDMPTHAKYRVVGSVG